MKWQLLSCFFLHFTYRMPFLGRCFLKRYPSYSRSMHGMSFLIAGEDILKLLGCRMNTATPIIYRPHSFCTKESNTPCEAHRVTQTRPRRKHPPIQTTPIMKGRRSLYPLSIRARLRWFYVWVYMPSNSSNTLSTRIIFLNLIGKSLSATTATWPARARARTHRLTHTVYL